MSDPVAGIYGFRNEYVFLSNFYPCARLYIKGFNYPTVEHVFQVAKTLDPEEILEIQPADTPGAAKKLGKQVTLRDDWEDIKDNVMLYIVKAKFIQNHDLGKQLIDTETAKIVEGNGWHDNYWGTCSCDRCCEIDGQNKLGKILMKVRSELQKL